MKIFFLILVLVSNCFTQSYNWVDLSNKIPANEVLIDVYFIGNNGWITGGKGKVYHTTDGGETFTTQMIPDSNLGTTSISMLNNSEGYLGTAVGKIFYTTNDGNVWNPVGTTNTPTLSISVPSSDSIGFACGIGSSVFKITPDSVEIDSNFSSVSWSSVCFPISSNEGWVTGVSTIRHKIDNLWKADQNYNANNFFNSIFFIDNMNGWVVGNAGVILHTSDGKNWVNQISPTKNHLFDVFFINNLEGWAVGDKGTIIHTTDSGMNWQLEVQNAAKGQRLSAVFAINNHTIYAVGGNGIAPNNGIFLKYMQLTDINEYQIQPNSFSLNQNYPNPFNPTTKIKYSIPFVKTGDAISVQLKVYDILGREIATLVNEKKSHGEYEVQFNGNNLPSGIYFYRLQSDSFSDTKKLILLR